MKSTGKKEQVIILGAKSDIAIALAKKYNAKGYDLILAGRNINEISEIKKTLETDKEQRVSLVNFDVLDYASHEIFFKQFTGKISGVICCVGFLGSQELAETNNVEAMSILNTNFTGCVSILNKAAERLLKQGSGFIIGISSVAGERGRKSNYFYGSAKAGFTAYLSGLRARLLEKQIHVLTVKPGFVATKMTAHLQLPRKLTASTEQVANAIYTAQQKEKNVLYSKAVWRPIMFTIRHIPEAIFKKLKL